MIVVWGFYIATAIFLVLLYLAIRDDGILATARYVGGFAYGIMLALFLYIRYNTK